MDGDQLMASEEDFSDEIGGYTPYYGEMDDGAYNDYNDLDSQLYV